MFKDFAVIVVIVISITVNVNGSTTNTLATKRGAILPPRKNTKKVLRTNSTKINDTTRENSNTIVRKTRTPQYLTLGQQNSLRLPPFALPYTSRFTGSMTPSSGLTLQQIQQLQQLKQLGQLRSFLPEQRLNTALEPSSLTPYQLQLARILPLLNLYRTKSLLKGNVGAGLPLNQPNRLKYDAIPLKPGFEGQALSDDRLSLLLGLGGLGANPYAAAKTEGGSVRSDMSDEDSDCFPNPCVNGGTCSMVDSGFKCVCATGYRGKICAEKDSCVPNPCQHGGDCSVSGSSFECSCAVGWKGERCEEENNCQRNPCQNGGSCTELRDGFECTCQHGFMGKKCETKRGMCATNPCLNDGQCVDKPDGGFECICKSGYSGSTCDAMENRCLTNPCNNGGSCIQTISGTGYECQCRSGYRGQNCDERSMCQPSTCSNGGTCFERDGGFKCLCLAGYSGAYCEEKHRCQLDQCHNGGRCIEHSEGFKCSCLSGYKGQYCDEMDHCHPNPCRHNGECVETLSGYKCHCQTQYQGTNCEEMNFCLPNPCKNGAQCVGYEGGYRCLCPKGYQGSNCEVKKACEPNPCRNGGACVTSGDDGKHACSCKRGFSGDKCEMVDKCFSNPCQNGGTCKNVEDGFECSCTSDYRGTLCQELAPCSPNPCHNGGKCIGTADGFLCRCAVGYKGDTCSDSDECEPNPCQNGGRCISHYFGGFDCECPIGFRGPSCQDRDPCRPNPCVHGGACSEIGGGYSCNCSTGYKGPRCEDIDECHPNPCKHGGVCREIVGGSGFACQCIAGYKGISCGEKDRCHPNPCQHDGMCMEVNDDLGYLCNCSSGFRGSRCEDLDPCHPNPCLNGAACLHSYDGFVCNCTLGFKGSHCQDRDLCKPNPCQFGDKCVQRGQDGYQCVKNFCDPNPCHNDGRCIEVDDSNFMCACNKGFSDKLCDVKDPCHPNPCSNGGSCSPGKFGGYKCSCTSSFRGESCSEPILNAMNSQSDQTELALKQPIKSKGANINLDFGYKRGKMTETYCTPSPCNNGGTCVVTDSGFKCSCQPQYAGELCETKNPCVPNPCLNNATCFLSDDKNDKFVCKCTTTYSGKTCADKGSTDNERKKGDIQEKGSDDSLNAKVDYCNPSPCKNKGVCVLEDAGGYSCTCQDGFSGTHCQVDQCLSNPCKHNGVCSRDKEKGFSCQCKGGFSGSQCEINNCLPNPCQNGGICLAAGSKGYQCKCRDGFTGLHCGRSPCLPNPCNNGGSCLVFYTVFLCKCPRDYRGSKCEVHIPESVPDLPSTSMHGATPHELPKKLEVEEGQTTKKSKADSRCNPNPCSNNGMCLESIDGGYECFCATNFSGPNCEEIGEYTYSSAPKFFPGKGEECKHCGKNAHCVGGHCICRTGFVGDGLECWEKTQADVNWTCDANPCKNGGTCKDGVSKCVCRLGYVGQFCEEYAPPSVHLSFDHVYSATLSDDTGDGNNAVLANGAQIVPRGGKCGDAVNLLGGDILFDGANFERIPRKAITISVWIKLDTNRGIQSIFDTVGSHSTHKDGQYHFEIDNGKVRWFHRDEQHRTVFSVLTQPVIKEGVWTQIAATYNAKKERARVYVNGDLKQEEEGSGLLSQDWGLKAGIGKHEHVFGNRLLRGMVDEFYIFPAELPRLELLVLMRHCKVYFSRVNRKRLQEKAKARAKVLMSLPYQSNRLFAQNSASFIPSPSGQGLLPSYQVNSVSPYKVNEPGSYGISMFAPKVLRKFSLQPEPAPSPTFISKNLKNILEAFGGDDKGRAQTQMPIPDAPVQNTQVQNFQSRTNIRTKPSKDFGAIRIPNGIQQNTGAKKYGFQTWPAYWTGNQNYGVITQQKKPSLQSSAAPLRYFTLGQGTISSGIPKQNGPFVQGHTRGVFVNPSTQIQNSLNRIPVTQQQGLNLDLPKQTLDITPQKKGLARRNPLLTVDLSSGQFKENTPQTVPYTNFRGANTPPRQLKNNFVYNRQLQAQSKPNVALSLRDRTRSFNSNENAIKSKPFSYGFGSKTNSVTKLADFRPLSGNKFMPITGNFRQQYMVKDVTHPNSQMQKPTLQMQTKKVPFSTMQAPASAQLPQNGIARFPVATNAKKLNFAAVPRRGPIGGLTQMTQFLQPQTAQFPAPKSQVAPSGPPAPSSQVSYNLSPLYEVTRNSNNRIQPTINVASTVYNPRTLAWLRQEYRQFNKASPKSDTSKTPSFRPFNPVISQRQILPNAFARGFNLPQPQAKLQSQPYPLFNAVGHGTLTQNGRPDLKPNLRQQYVYANQPVYNYRPESVFQTDTKHMNTVRPKSYMFPQSNTLTYNTAYYNQGPNVASLVGLQSRQKSALPHPRSQRSKTHKDLNANPTLMSRGQSQLATHRNNVPLPSNNKLKSRSASLYTLVKDLLYLKHKKKRKKRKIKSIRKKSINPTSQ